MRIAADSVEDYLAQVPAGRQAALRPIRDLIRTTVPDVEENLAYGMPTYWVDGQFLCAFASQKNYMSLYLDTELVARHRPAFGSLNCGSQLYPFHSSGTPASGHGCYNSGPDLRPPAGCNPITLMVGFGNCPIAGL